MNEYSDWLITIAGAALITVVPLFAVGEMKKRRSSLIYPVWFTAGSSAAGYSLLFSATSLGEASGASAGAKLFFGVVWWFYLAIVSEGIASSWPKLQDQSTRD